MSLKDKLILTNRAYAILSQRVANKRRRIIEYHTKMTAETIQRIEEEITQLIDQMMRIEEENKEA